MKKLIGVFATLVIGYVMTAAPAYAREGSIHLSNPDVSCEGVSLWRESTYKITGRCQGLVYPYETLEDHYVIWAKMDNGNTVRVDDIDRGYFDGSVTGSFTDLIVTAEGSSSPRRPSSTQVLAGSIDPFSFDKSTTTAPQASVAPSVRPAASAAAKSTVQAGSTVGSVIGKILKSLMVIIGVVILVAVIASLLFRRRGSVSA